MSCSWANFERTFRSEELSGDVEGFATDDDDLLAVEKLLGDDTGETAEKVAFAVDDNLSVSLAFVRDVQPVAPWLARSLEGAETVRTTGSNCDILTAVCCCQDML